MKKSNEKLYRQLTILISYELAIILAELVHNLVWRFLLSLLLFLAFLTLMNIFAIDANKKEKKAMVAIIIAFLFVPTINIMPTDEQLTVILNIGFLISFVIAFFMDKDFFDIKETRSDILGLFILVPIFLFFAYGLIQIFIHPDPLAGFALVIITFILLGIGALISRCLNSIVDKKNLINDQTFEEYYDQRDKSN